MDEEITCSGLTEETSLTCSAMRPSSQRRCSRALLFLLASARRRRVLPVSPGSFAGLSRSRRSGRAAIDQDDPSAEPIAATLRAQQDPQIDDRHDRAAVIEHSREETGGMGQPAEIDPGHDLDHVRHVDRVQVLGGSERQQ